MSQSGTKELTREELYERVWSKPATELAAELGISDVALSKRCKKLNVPKPSLGYWARIAAGQTPTRPPLPPTPEKVFAHAAQQPVGKALTLPGEGEPLHPLAAELSRTLTKARLDSHKRASVRERTLPEAAASKALAERVARAFHVILSGVEHLGICFRKAQSSYDSGYFQKSHDRLYLKIEEVLIETDGATRHRSSWQWQADHRVPSGRLTFSLNAERYGTRSAKEWAESDKVSIEEVLAKVVAAIRSHYVEAQERRAREAIEREKQRVESERRWREYQAQETIRLRQEQERKHAEAVAFATRTRTEDLLKAAEWWRLNRALTEFINACEQRWKNPSGELTAEQRTWLAWAKETARLLSPFEAGYPDPTKDGTFDAGAVPFGGPYPAKRNFPRPPTMPTAPPSGGLPTGHAGDRDTQ
jgi:hypothetical protein